jgi:glucose-6-phosphate 1-dehydrogenase
VSAPAATEANPFAADVTDRLPPPTTFVMFGATGDLAARKLWPALYNLAADGELPERFRVVAIARSADTDEMRSRAGESVARHSRTGRDDEAWESVARATAVVQGTFDDPALYDRLREELDRGDDEAGGPMRRLFYLAVAPEFFGPIATGLARVGLGRGADPPTALIIEKPFGHDLASAAALQDELEGAFEERQIFRIDHYLGKETVQNLLVLRFVNGIFEPLWNDRYVDHVQITVAEDVGIGHRAGYYEGSGALRDIVQNHALQLVSLVAMEPPASFTADEIRDEKVKVLRSVRRFAADEIPQYVVRGQYAAGFVGGEPVPGYLDEPDVPPGSHTDTFVAARFEVNNWRWAGTPFYVRTGKRLRSRAAEIAIEFASAPHLPFAGRDIGHVAPNALVLSVQPNEGVSLRMVAKVPGAGMMVRPVQMDFQYGSTFLRAAPEAYERLLHDALAGDATLFTRSDEVEEAWRIVQPIIDAWAADADGGPAPYEAGGAGPEAADALLAVRGRSWRRL